MGTESTEMTTTNRNAGLGMLADPESFNHLVRVATAFSKTAIIPDAYRGKPQDCMIAIDMADRMGISPMMVMQNLYVVKGKPSWSGQACMSLIQACGKFVNVQPVYFGEKGTEKRGCYVQAARMTNGETVTGVEVTMQMARAEGWMSNAKWRNMPELMLAYRAAAFFARVHCPESLMGVHVEGEIDDFVPDKAVPRDPLAAEAVILEPLVSESVGAESPVSDNGEERDFFDEFIEE